MDFLPPGFPIEEVNKPHGGACTPLGRLSILWYQSISTWTQNDECFVSFRACLIGLERQKWFVGHSATDLRQKIKLSFFSLFLPSKQSHFKILFPNSFRGFSFYLWQWIPCWHLNSRDLESQGSRRVFWMQCCESLLLYSVNPTEILPYFDNLL